MKNLQEATERICELKGSLVALDALVPAVIEALSEPTRARLADSFDAYAEAARTVLLHAEISDVVLASFERDVARNRAVLQGSRHAGPPTVDALLLATTRIGTFDGPRALTSASGFFFRRGERLFLVSSRHVFADAESSHYPDRIEFVLHTDTHDLARHAVVSLPLYHDGLGQWRDGTDGGGAVDVAAIEIPPGLLPAGATLQAFDESHLDARGEDVAIGDTLGIAGFPLGFQDTVHHLAVLRSASIASAYGVRFQRQGYFLTDARTHRGSSGSPVVRRRSQGGATASPLAWQLLGVHSTRMDMRSRDQTEDESLGLNCAWYADVLLTLTEER
ncbi:trypsin-like peptidase domain-containing protein [Rubrivivax gelatinosus]|uniref:Trypsin-like peptidase n=1 Tax=Rubrivivax gelatinosus TaxID=28068 RepID=A0A4R2MJ21_RUBGE|nr:trypsin-like peptidase domain-containing protein [Rubrivivax gelatinosus]TCP04714.1 trypsin-like peptidase [Rubrivivax gelatinosus]